MAVIATIRNLLDQWFPPKPLFTETDVPLQTGKVFIVTGGNSGVGYELISMLYGKGATIYMASRSKVSIVI
jgi:NADPH:quinone reductase-like Zn-dependent oxidoreductase